MIHPVAVKRSGFIFEKLGRRGKTLRNDEDPNSDNKYDSRKIGITIPSLT